MDESVDDHGRPADEEGDGDGGHEQVHAPAPLLHRLVRARRPEDANREREVVFKFDPFWPISFLPLSRTFLRVRSVPVLEIYL